MEQKLSDIAKKLLPDEDDDQTVSSGHKQTLIKDKLHSSNYMLNDSMGESSDDESDIEAFEKYQKGKKNRLQGDQSVRNNLLTHSDTDSDGNERTFSVDIVPKGVGGLQVMRATAVPPLIFTGVPLADESRISDDRNDNDVSITNVLSNTLGKLKKMLGMSPNCVNGGTKTLKGDCVCPKYFKGDLCQETICINNGTFVKVPNLIPARFACKCPHPEYISGAHCETVKCMNGGRPMENGHCRCLDYWYTGQFCQNYTASWGAVLGVPLVCVVIIIICCVVCRLDLCPRKQTRPRRRRRAVPASAFGQNSRSDRWSQPRNIQREVTTPRRGYESSLRLQENLLNEENPNLAQGVRPERGATPSFVIRLDTIPVFNPRMLGGVGDQDLKHVDPPPSYEQVIASGNAVAEDTTRDMQRPPEYTPRASQPPPPRFRPPDAPRNG